MSVVSSIDVDSLAYDDRGLLPVVVQDVTSGAVLMVAWADREAVTRTLATGEAHFWSRSRQTLWRKGETSGHTLRVVDVTADCDRDTLLVRAHPEGPTCHLGERSCFEPNVAGLELGWLAQILEQRGREGDTDSSYTARLLAAGVDRIARKLGEEATETVIAAVRADAVRADAGGGDVERRELIGESADLLYHLLVLLRALDVAPLEIAAELARRHRDHERQPPRREDG